MEQKDYEILIFLLLFVFIHDKIQLLLGIIQLYYPPFCDWFWFFIAILTSNNLEQVQVHRFGWKWNYNAQWNAVLLWGTVASNGVHGPRACALWGHLVSDSWHDQTRGSFPSTYIYYLSVIQLCPFCISSNAFKFYSQNESFFTLRDLKGSKLSGNVFNILFNLNKFMAFETRDPFLIRQVNEVFNFVS